MECCDVSPCICGLGSLLRVLRRGAGYYDEKGRWIDGTDSTVDVTAVVEPLSPHEMVRLPEGHRTTGSVKVYSQSKLLTADVAAHRQPDRFCWHGEEYEVLSVDDWSLGGYYKAIAVEVGQ